MRGSKPLVLNGVPIDEYSSLVPPASPHDTDDDDSTDSEDGNQSDAGSVVGSSSSAAHQRWSMSEAVANKLNILEAENADLRKVSHASAFFCTLCWSMAAFCSCLLSACISFLLAQHVTPHVWFMAVHQDLKMAEQKN